MRTNFNAVIGYLFSSKVISKKVVGNCVDIDHSR